ncbi:hypothetical protein DFH06DRAFT_1229880, partial [Mycena polygramma]
MTGWTTIPLSPQSVQGTAAATSTEKPPAPSGTSSEASPNAPGTSNTIVATDIDAIPTTEVNSKNPPTLSGHPGEASENGIETSGNVEPAGADVAQVIEADADGLHPDTPRWFRDWHRTQFLPLRQTLNDGDIRASPPKTANDGALSLNQKVARTGRSIGSIMASLDAVKTQALAHRQAATACNSVSTKESSGFQEGDHRGEYPGRGKPSTEDPWRESLRRRRQFQSSDNTTFGETVRTGLRGPREDDATVSDPNEYHGRRRYPANASRNLQSIGRRRCLWEG